MNNYYFKFLEKNEGLHQWVAHGKNLIDVDLSIYYDDHFSSPEFKWKADQKDAAIEHYRKDKKKSKNIRQIEVFYKLEFELDCYFWIFMGDKVYAYKGIDLKVKDGEGFMKVKKNESNPKSISVKLHNGEAYKKECLPEFFSNINSNQKYNRGTIEKLGDAENEFATALIKSQKVIVNKWNFHEYLSPIEFETLIFLIFNDNDKGNMCSSFRGGTLKDFDLRVKVNNPFSDIPAGTYLIQLKKKNGKPKTESKKYYYIHTGEKQNVEKKELGIQWIREQIENTPFIKKWLREMTFNYPNFIDFKW